MTSEGPWPTDDQVIWMDSQNLIARFNRDYSASRLEITTGQSKTLML